MLLGALFIFTAIPAVDINLFGAAVYALLVVYVSSGRTLLYLDLAYRHETAPVPAPRPLRERLRLRLRRKRAAPAAVPGPSTSRA